MKRLMIMGALAVGICPLGSSASAAPGEATTPPPVQAAASATGSVTLSLRDVPLRTALETLFNGSGLQHAVEPAVPNYPITLDIREVPFSTVLRTILRLAPGVVYRKEGDIYIVGMRSPAVEQPTAGQDAQPPEQKNGAPQLQYERVPLNFTHSQVLGYIMGGQSIPTEDQIHGGGGYGGGGYGGGGYGGGLGGLSGGGYGGGFGGYGGGGGGFGGGGLGGLGGGLGGFGGGGFGGGLGGGFGGGGFGGGGFGGGLGGFGGGGIGGLGGGIGGGGYVGPRANRF